MEATATQPEPQVFAAPQREHHWLQKLVGEWTYEGECPSEPGQPPMKSLGTESVRSLGGLWIMAEGHGTMPDGSPATTLKTLGFDPRRGRYVGALIGSMMDFMWHLNGALDAAERELVLDADGPSMADPTQTTKYRDAIEFVSDDHRIVTSQVLGDDGTWQRYLTAHYRRAG